MTVTPTSRDAIVLVNGRRVVDTAPLHHGQVVQFGKMHSFRYFDPAVELVSSASQTIGLGSVVAKTYILNCQNCMVTFFLDPYLWLVEHKMRIFGLLNK